MMDLGELPGHPDFNKLLVILEKQLDTWRDRVIVLAEKDDIGELKVAVGKDRAMRGLLAGLLEAKERSNA